VPCALNCVVPASHRVTVYCQSLRSVQCVCTATAEQNMDVMQSAAPRGSAVGLHDTASFVQRHAAGAHLSAADTHRVYVPC